MYNPYELMYDAEMTVSRWEKADVDGFTEHRLVLVAEGVRCRYSSSGQVSTGAPDPSIQNQYTIFCGLDADVKEGDLVEITLRTGKMVGGTLGECHPYTYQWQCRLKRNEEA